MYGFIYGQMNITFHRFIVAEWIGQITINIQSWNVRLSIFDFYKHEHMLTFIIHIWLCKMIGTNCKMSLLKFIEYEYKYTRKYFTYN